MNFQFLNVFKPFVIQKYLDSRHQRVRKHPTRWTYYIPLQLEFRLRFHSCGPENGSVEVCSDPLTQTITTLTLLSLIEESKNDTNLNFQTAPLVTIFCSFTFRISCSHGLSAVIVSSPDTVCAPSTTLFLSRSRASILLGL